MLRWGGGLPGVVTGDVVEEGLGLIIVTVGPQGSAPPLLLSSAALAGLGLCARLRLLLSVHRLLRLDHLLIWGVKAAAAQITHSCSTMRSYRTTYGTG